MPCYSPSQRFSRPTPFSPFVPVTDIASFLSALDASVSPPPRSFQPRFDVREEATAYKLNGELPGIEQKDITLEFADQDTLIIRGRSVAREARIAEPTEPKPVEQTESESDTASDAGSAYQKPTVEEDFVNVPAGNEKTPASTTVTETEKPAQDQPEKKAEPIKYLLHERITGEFNRSFTFPGHVDQEGVTASLKKGILSVVVPKAAVKAPKQIVIQ